MNIIKKTGKFMQLDLSYLLRNGFVLGGGHFSATFLGFLLTLVFANLIESTVYGQYKYVSSVAGILSAFTLSGAYTTVVQSVSKGYEGALFVEQKLYLKWSSLSILASFVVGGYYIYKNDSVLGLGIILATVLGYLYNFLTLHNAFLNGKKDFKRISRNLILNAAALLIAIGTALFFGFNTTLWIIGLYYGSQILFQIFAYWNTIKVFKPLDTVDHTDKNFSVHTSLGNMITFVAEYMDKILIFQFFGAYQVALYAFAVGVPDQIRSINKVMSTLIIPKLTSKDPDELERSVRMHTKKYILISVLTLILFYFVSPSIYNFFFPVYSEAASYASLYLLLLPITAICTMHGYAIQIRKDVKSLYIIKIVDSIGKIVLFVFFIPWLGVLGAILSILISKLCTALLQIALYHRYSQKQSQES